MVLVWNDLLLFEMVGLDNSESLLEAMVNYIPHAVAFVSTVN